LSDQVTVRIPASTGHVRVVRATASALGALVELTYDRITDLHIAIDEVWSRILATSGPRATRVEFSFRLEEGGLAVTARADAPMRPGATFLTGWSETILRSVTDDIRIDQVDGAALVLFRVSRG
jgi:anti-sigma regulatory factor (Ser/Thr protein kinase)